MCRPVVQRAVGSLINGSLLPTAAAADVCRLAYILLVQTDLRFAHLLG